MTVAVQHFYGFTLTVLANEELPGDPDALEEDEEKELEESWTPKFRAAEELINRTIPSLLLLHIKTN